MTDRLSAAGALLRLLSDGRGRSGGSDVTAVDRHRPTIDWREIADIAARYDLGPVLFKRLRESDARAQVPGDVWERLRRAYFVSAVRNRRRYRLLGPVLHRLRESGIKVIVLKGAFLAQEVYGEVALRPMCDMDLMIPRSELPRARAVLLDLGSIHQQSEDIESLCRRATHLPAFFIHDLPIEIHWTIARPTGPVSLDAAGLWRRARPALIAGVEVLALSPEDLLLHLCLHICHLHRLEVGLRCFYDVTVTIDRFRNEMDWARVVDTAREWGAARHAGLALCLAGDLFGAAVPAEVLERLMPGGLGQRMLETAREAVLAETGYGRSVPFFQLRGARSLGDKARLSWSRVFLSRGEMAAVYPASRDSKHLWFYYALRLGDAVRTYAKHTLRRGRLTRRSHDREQDALLFDWLDAGKPGDRGLTTED